MFRSLANRMRVLVRDEKGLATVEWIGLALVILAVLIITANAMERADGTTLATKVLDAIGRMLERVP